MRHARCAGHGPPTCSRAISRAASLQWQYRTGRLTARTATTRERAWEAGAWKTLTWQSATWTVNGSNRNYQVAGLGSWRVEDVDVAIGYTGHWTTALGNYSGGSISYATTPGASVSYSYQSPQNHILNLGTRRFPTAAQLSVQVDRNPPQVLSVALPGEDVLVRWDLGDMSGGTQHTVKITHTGDAGSTFYFDFLEIAIPTGDLPTFVPDPETTLATDWDTLHSQALAPERTAWLIQALGFTGRANHYAGALWFYELTCAGQQYEI